MKKPFSTIKAIQAVAHDRPAGYVAAALAAGEVQGDRVVWTVEAYRELKRKFPPLMRPPEPIHDDYEPTPINATKGSCCDGNSA